jgi:uncharacterized protein YndB with AHSA1/START domain
MTATSTHETEIVADPDVPLIRITRDFDAPREKVFRAHTDPELMAQWMGPSPRDADRALRLPDRRVVPLHDAQRRQRSSASTGPSTTCGPRS